MICGATIPEENNYVCIADMAKEIGCGRQTIVTIASKLGYDLLIFKKSHGGRSGGYYTLEQKNKIAQMYQLYGTNYKAMKHDDKADLQSEDLHPLVKNKDYLKLNVWPEIIPSCFQECEV
jgi:hypothetical protein